MKLEKPSGPPGSSKEEITVFYDGDCPICTREIAFYKSCRGSTEIEWIDLAGVEHEQVCEGLSRDEALARFSVRTADGTLHRGAAGFVKMWRMLPAFRVVGRLLSVPPLVWMLDRIYDVLLLVRPKLQKLFVR